MSHCQLLLFLYFVASVHGRAYAVLLFLTPSLGLFNTLNMVEVSGQRIFDVGPEGQVVTLAETWSQFKIDHASEFVDTAAMRTAFYGIPPLLIFVHVSAIVSIRKRVLMKAGRFHWKDIYCSVCPPLFYDWLHLYANSLSDGDDGGHLD